MSRKKTHEEYVNELAVKNPMVKAVDEYIDANTPILHHCLQHDVFWNTTPSRAMAGVGCCKCHRERFRRSRLKSHEQYIKEIAVANPDVDVVGTYVDAKTPIDHYCNKHNVIWNALPGNVLKGCGCPDCCKEKIGEKNRKTHEQYVAEVAVVNPNIEVLGDYVDTETPIPHRCKIDGYIWSPKPANVLQGKGCPKCAGNLQLTNDECVECLSVVNPNIKALEEYINAKTPLLHQCLIDGYIWPTIPSSTLQGYGCPKCAGNLKKTHEGYVYELSIKNPDIEVLEQYINAKTPILHRCRIDGYIWRIAPSNVLSGQNCPQCQESNGEKQITYWLKKHGFTYVYQKKFADCRYKKELPFDFYLPDYNILIEYDGQQHFEPIDFAGKGDKWALEQFKLVQHRDVIKNQYCEHNNIQLLRIPYFKNVDEELEKFLFILI